MHSKLIDWYKRHYRLLPWRETHDPYLIWLSEIILQQTRVEQGLPYYQRFCEQFPTVNHLAKAPQEQVLKLWEGLGYYSRARNLHQAAQMVVSNFDAEFPKTYQDIRSLKGVGDYTAAAIASFAYDLPHAVLDGNVMRVLSRFHAEPTPINTSTGKRLFQKLADGFLNDQDPATHNQAMMELGATICKPRNPDCELCPLQEACKAKARGAVMDYPVKNRKKYDKRRHLNFWFIKKGDKTFVEQRKAGIWKGLYQFPIYESDEVLAPEAAATQWLKMGLRMGDYDSQIHRLPMHKLSHQSLYISIWEIRLSPDANLVISEPWQAILLSKMKDLAFPRPIRKFLDENQLTLPLE